MSFNRLFWGLFIILLGVLFMGISIGWWNSNIWLDILSLWPVLIILLGISIIFGDKPIGLFLLIIILILSVAYVANLGNVKTKIERKTGSSLTQTVNSFEENLSLETKRVKFTLDLGALSLNLNSTSESLVKGEFIGGSVNVKKQMSGDLESVQIRDSSDIKISRLKNDRTLNLSITDKLPVEIDLNTGASKETLDFSRIHLTKLSLNSGASKSEIKLGQLEYKIDLEINTGASKINLSLPENYALKIRNDSALVNNNFNQLGLDKIDKGYQSKDYGTNGKQISVVISAGASTINIERY